MLFFYAVAKPFRTGGILLFCSPVKLEKMSENPRSLHEKFVLLVVAALISFMFVKILFF